MNDITPEITSNNIELLRTQISKKISSVPYFATNNLARGVITDMDHHPYSRWFRGVYYNPEPIVMEREAGWRPLENNCYNLIIPPQKEIAPEHCFEVPCTTTLPCYPKYLTKYADKEALDIMINNTCIPQYR